jgi:hypothetical protein
VAAVVSAVVAADVAVFPESEDEPQPVAVATASAARTKSDGRTRMDSGAYLPAPVGV